MLWNLTFSHSAGAETAVEFLANVLIQTTVLLVAGLIAGRSLRRAGAAVQSVLYRTALAAALLCPLASWGLLAAGVDGLVLRLPQRAQPVEIAIQTAAPSVPEPIPAASSSPEIADWAIAAPDAGPVPVVELAESVPADSPVPAVAMEPPAPSQTEPDKTHPSIDWLPSVLVLAAVAWLTASLLLYVRLAVAHEQTVRLRRSAVPAGETETALCRRVAEEFRARPPEVLRTPFLSGPCLVGLRRPAVLLPEGDDSPLREALIHELAHLVRRDCLWNLLRRLATAALPVQPLLWIISRRIEQTAEEVCDDYVVQFGADRCRYADHLVELASRALPPALPAGVGMISVRSLPARRIARILDASRTLSTRTGRRVLAAILTAGLAGTLFASLLGVGTAEDEEASSAIPHQEDIANDTETPPGIPDEDKRFLIVGRVVDPAGQAVAGAEVFAVSATGRFAAGTRSNADGEFEIRFTRSSVDSPPGTKDWRHGSLVARHPGYGPGWIRVGELEAQPEPVLRLTEDVPIRGRILDLEGRPVAGAKLQVIDIHGSDEQNLDGYLKAVRDQPTRAWLHARDHLRHLSAATLQLAADAVPGTEPEETVLTTDEEGYFELRGIGRERAVRFDLTGPGIESSLITVVTRPEIEPEWKREHLSREARMYHEIGEPLPVVHAATFEHLAGPSRPISGTVRDRETDRPLAGIRVGGWMRGRDNSAHTHTDEDGRYELHGLAMEGTIDLGARPPEGMPYLPAERQIRIAAPSPGGEIDFALTRGVIVRGRSIEAETGEPVDGQIQYSAFPDNASAQDLAGTLDTPWTNTKDGRFEITVLPRPGFLAARARDDRYMAATAEDFGGRAGRQSNGRFATVNRGLILPDDFHVVKPIDPSPGDEPLEIELRFHSGQAVAGRLVDSAGRPVTGATARGLGAVSLSTTLDGAEFSVTGMREDETRTVVFRHESRELGAMVRFTGAEHEPAVVTMRPLATLTGRIIDAQARPATGVQLTAYTEGAGQWFRQQGMGQRPDGEQPVNLGTDEPTMTDADGRFRVTELIPGVRGELRATPPEAYEGGMDQPIVARFALGTGETRDLGELALADPKAKPAEGPAEAAAGPASSRPAEGRGRTLRGRVVDPDGKPVASARLYVLHPQNAAPWPWAESKPWFHRVATTDSEGRFEASMTSSDLPRLDEEVTLIATADNYGLDWMVLRDRKPEEPLVFSLNEDQAIRGRVLDSEGRPVTDARVAVVHLFRPSTGQLDRFLAEWRQTADEAYPGRGTMLHGRLDELLQISLPDRHGRFEIRGLGKERVAGVMVSGAAIAQMRLHVVLRAGVDPDPLNDAVRQSWFLRPPPPPSLFAPSFTFVAEPGRVVEGTVREAETGRPVPHATVTADGGYGGLLSAVTDAAGKFQLTGMSSLKRRYTVSVVPPERSALLARELDVSNDSRLGPLKTDVELARGVVVTGRVADRVTGEGVPAYLDIVPLPGNKYPYRIGRDSRFWTKSSSDGRFQLTAIPGPIVIRARALGGELAIDGQSASAFKSSPYRRASFTEQDQQRVALSEDGRRFATASDRLADINFHHAVKVLDSEGEGLVRCDLFVEPGKTVDVHITDMDGRPLTGTVVAGATAVPPTAFRADKSQCTIYALNPDEPRQVLFYHPDRRLGGSIVLRGDENAPQPVRLKRTFALTGRAVDSGGQPVTGAQMIVAFDATAYELYQEAGLTHDGAATDENGHFRVQHLVPNLQFLGLTFRQRQTLLVPENPLITALREIADESTTEIDLGDVKVKPLN